MAIINTISLESNRKIKINFNGGELSSDGGLLLIKEFAAKIGLITLVNQIFKTNDHTNCRKHTDPDNLMQIIYQIISAYFTDDCADELVRDPVLTAILGKEKLASAAYAVPLLEPYGRSYSFTTGSHHGKNARSRLFRSASGTHAV